MDDDAPTAKVKMSGYLHLKIKKRFVPSWKSYWFVLEDRLLLFYRSKTEYEAISPCKGSISLGPPCTVKSLSSVHNAFQIETRITTYTLKAANSEDQKKWMQFILSALNQNQNFAVTEGAKRLNHFRYSLDDLIPEVEPNDQVLHMTFQRQNTLPIKTPKDNEIIQRLQKIGAQSYGGSLGAISKIATRKVVPLPLSKNKATSSQVVLPEEDFLRYQPRENIYERISGESQGSDRVSFLVDNENYSVPVRKSVSVLEEKSPGVVQQRETKSLIVENDQYGFSRQAQSEEVVYAEPKFHGRTDFNKNSVLVDNTLYASADVVKTSSENIYEDLDKYELYSRPTVDSEHSSQSSVDKEEKCESNKAKVPAPKSLKKSKSFIKRVWKKKKSKKEEKPDEIYEEIDPIVVEKVAVTDDSAIQMLSELQNILEKQKTKLKATTSNPVSSSETSPTDSESVCPSLPPKTHKLSQDTLSKQPEQLRSLDEILEDLDKERVEAKGKVQVLIEKFSEPEDVILRKHDLKEHRHSDDLSKLLDELAKVTSAPIMTPGVTSSLVNPDLTDEEWLKLLPVRQRRLSEPDYDVPRPHRYIPSPEKPASDVIPATRFFGPVLQPIDTKEESLPISMTPDSLEVEEQPKYENHFSYTSHHYNNPRDLAVFSHDDKIIYAFPKSYVSVATHIVNTCQNLCGAHATEETTIVYKSVKNVEVQEEVFNDSLELCETTTEF